MSTTAEEKTDPAAEALKAIAEHRGFTEGTHKLERLAEHSAMERDRWHGTARMWAETALRIDPFAEKPSCGLCGVAGG